MKTKTGLTISNTTARIEVDSEKLNNDPNYNKPAGLVCLFKMWGMDYKNEI